MALRPAAARPSVVDAAALAPALAAVAPGVALCAALALAATLLSMATGVPAMLAVLLAGLGTRVVAPGFVARVAAGINFSASTVLRFGIVLLGLRVVAGDIATLGPSTIGLVLGSVAVTVGGGYLIARLFRQPADIAAVAATSVAICGASAALAASAVVPRRPAMERETLLIIIVVSLLSTVVMLLYPAIAALLDLSGSQTAVLLGAAIHDVAQVAGAGFSVSPEIGVAAVTVKMIRVACLLPVVATIGFLACRGPAQCSGTGAPRQYLPPFLIGFFLLALLASTGAVPAAVAGLGGQAAGWALTIAVAALGLKTGFAELRAARPALVATLAVQTALQFSVVLALVLLVTA
jgi:uncharacterized integral membrane protein (TIGR00698 family)